MYGSGDDAEMLLMSCGGVLCCRVTVLSLQGARDTQVPVMCSIDRRRTVGLHFSPKNTFLVTWEPLSGVFFLTSLFTLLKDLPRL